MIAIIHRSQGDQAVNRHEPVVIAIDPALRQTGICLLGGGGQGRWTMDYRGGYAAAVREWIETAGWPQQLDRVQVVIEVPPARVRHTRTQQGALLGYCSGVWAGLLSMHPIRPVEVSEWRKVMLGTRLGTGADTLAMARARQEALRLGILQPIDDHQAEAILIARWWQITRGVSDGG